MKKRLALEKKFSFSNRVLYSLITLGILSILAVGVYAYGTLAPETFGHSAGELNVDINGVTKTLQEAIDGGDFDSGSSSPWTSSGNDIYYNEGKVRIGTTSTSSASALSAVGASGIIGSGTSSAGTGVAGYGGTEAIWNGASYYGGKGVYGSGYVGVKGAGYFIGVEGASDVYGSPENSYGYGYDFYASGLGTNYGSSSSIRWKDNITNIDNSLDKVLKLDGVYYDWDEEHGGFHDMGFIAEDVGVIVPEIVGFEDSTRESNWYVDEETGEKKLYATGVDYGALTPLLTEAIKEQQSQIEELKRRVEELER